MGPSDPHHMPPGVCTAAGGGGQDKQQSKARKQSRGANLLSLRLRASIQVIGRLDLRLHSLIIYPGKRGMGGSW